VRGFLRCETGGGVVVVLLLSRWLPELCVSGSRHRNIFVRLFSLSISVELKNKEAEFLITTDTLEKSLSC
jgi:hypothetical protein